MNGENSENFPNPKVINANNKSKFPFLMLSIFALIIFMGIAGYYFFFKKNLSLNQHSQVSTPQKKKYIVNPALQKGPFACPAAVNYCNFSAKSSSVSAKLAQDSKLYAAFAGEVKILPQHDKNLTVVELADDNRGLRANYYFSGGKVSKLTSIKQGDVIATTGGQLLPFPLLKDKTFLFVLFHRLTDVGWKRADLSSSDFVK